MNQKSNVLVIPAAGAATRLRPLSNNMSKCMVPVNGKPAIAHIIDTVGHLYDEICVVHGFNHDVVDYMRRNYADLNVSFYQQFVQEGPLHAIHCALRNPKYDSILLGKLTVWLGDTLVFDWNDFSLDELIHPVSCAIAVSKVKDWTRWCMVDGFGLYYDKPTERPPTEMALVGIYQFSSFKQARDYITQIIESEKKVKGEYQISQLLEYFEGDTRQVVVRDWHDIGDLPSLYKTKANLISRRARTDNHIECDPEACTVTKTGSRCKGEILWYDTFAKMQPQNLHLVPQIYSSDITRGNYTMALCSGTTLQEMFVYEDLKDDTIEYLITKVFNNYKKMIVPQMQYALPPETWIEEEFFAKFRRRASGSTNPSETKRIIEFAKSLTPKTVTGVGIIHGDLHCGNIMFDPTTGSMKFIDPRGYDMNAAFYFPYYDFIKLYQSFYGDYMWIINDMPVNQRVKKVALNTLDRLYSENNIDLNFVKAMVAVFLSGIWQFHDDRQDHIKLFEKKASEILNELKQQIK